MKNDTAYVILTGRNHKGSALGPSEVYGSFWDENIAEQIASGFDYWEWNEDTVSSDRTVQNSYALIYESEIDAARDIEGERIERVRTDTDIDESGVTSDVNVSVFVDLECVCGTMITVSDDVPGCSECGEIWNINHD